ncbi:MAG: hypothetical protein ACKVOJ_03865, partial [Sphingomonadaceae bacterium]
MTLIKFSAGVVAALLLSTTAQAAVVGFTANPTANRQNWTAAVLASGGTTQTNITFDAPNAGASLGAVTGFGAPVFSGGPGQGNTFSGPLSSGQGLYTPSLHRESNSSVFSLTTNFNAPVSAVGIDVIDYFGASGFNNFLNLSVFSGANGTGTLLGSFTSSQFNFQRNNVYFLGAVSTANDIGSAVFSRRTDNTGDVIGVDNIVSGVIGAVPEPT